MSWYLMAFQKFAKFSGRSRRKEYWMFYLFNILMAIIIGFIEIALFGKQSIISTIYICIIIIPSLSLTSRRLHDTDHSAWWMAINLIPIAGPIWFFYMLCQDSDHYVNRFGEDSTADNNSFKFDKIGD